MNKRRQRFLPTDKTRGIAAVECAICLLALFPIMFGTLEICSAYYLEESLTIAAYEGARFGARQDTTPDMVRAYILEILVERGITLDTGEITFDPPNFNTDGVQQNVLDPLTVTVSTTTGANSSFVFGQLADRTLTASVTFALETGDPPLNLNSF